MALDPIGALIDLWYIWLPIGLVIIIIMWFLTSKGEKYGFKVFEPVPLDKTLGVGLSKKIKLFGQNFNGSMWISYNRVGRIGKYFKSVGKFDYEAYDPTNKEIITDDSQSQEYDVLVCEKVADFPLWRLLGIFKEYIILERKDEENKEMFEIDLINKRIFLFDGTDLISYGKVWTNTMSGIEYLNNISTIKMNEQSRMHLENMPDKFAHLEMEQAKKERLQKVITDLERSKYKERETAGDTSII